MLFYLDLLIPETPWLMVKNTCSVHYFSIVYEIWYVLLTCVKQKQTGTVTLVCISFRPEVEGCGMVWRD